MANKLNNAFEVINAIYDDLREATRGQEADVDIIIGRMKESLDDKRAKFERFFNWENVTFKPFEELDKTDSDPIMQNAISNSEKVARYKAIGKYIESDFAGSSLTVALETFSNLFLSIVSDSASDTVLEFYNSEYYPTSLGVLKTTARGLPLLIPDPRKPHNELIRHFDRTTMLGLVARNAIRGGFIYDASCLYRIIAIAAMLAQLNKQIEEEEREINDLDLKTVLNNKAFFESHFKQYFAEGYRDAFISGSDNQNIKNFKIETLNSLTSLAQAFATLTVVDFSFFYPFIVTRYIVNAKDPITVGANEFDNDLFSLKTFTDSSIALYEEILAYNDYIINIA